MRTHMYFEELGFSVMLRMMYLNTRGITELQYMIRTPLIYAVSRYTNWHPM